MGSMRNSVPPVCPAMYLATCSVLPPQLKYAIRVLPFCANTCIPPIMIRAMRVIIFVFICLYFNRLLSSVICLAKPACRVPPRLLLAFVSSGGSCLQPRPAFPCCAMSVFCPCSCRFHLQLCYPSMQFTPMRQVDMAAHKVVVVSNRMFFLVQSYC